MDVERAAKESARIFAAEWEVLDLPRPQPKAGPRPEDLDRLAGMDLVYPSFASRARSSQSPAVRWMM